MDPLQQQPNPESAPPAPPPTLPPQRPTSPSQDLNLIGILHYVMGGLTGAASLIPLIHVTIGILMANGMIPSTTPQDAQALKVMSTLFIVMGSIIIISGLTLSVCIILAGRFISRRKNYTFCFVIACIECLSAPLGTALGVFTIVSLCKPENKSQFGRT